MAKGILLVALVVVFAGVALDLAVYISRIGKAQWEAENMALAAARQLATNGNGEDALVAANNWMANNERDTSRIHCCTFADLRPAGKPDGTLDTVTATSEADLSLLFLDHLGLSNVFSTERSATAQVSGAAGAPICPWGVVVGQPAPGGGCFGLVPGRVYTLDLNGSSQGALGLVPLDVTGAGTEGYEKVLAAGCRQDETGVWSAGDVVPSLPAGAELIAGTFDALGDYYNFEIGDGMGDYLGLEWCDVTFDADGSITGFNPYLQLPRSECVRGSEEGVGRLMVVPIVTPPDGGTVRILGLATMYLASWDRGPADAQRIYGVFFERTRIAADSANLTGRDDSPLAPLRVALLN